MTGIHVPLVHSAIPQRHFQSRYFAQNKPSQLQMGYTLLVPRYLISLWDVIIFTYPQRTIAWIITGNEATAGKICPPNKQIEIATVPTPYFTIYRHKWIDPRPQTPGSLKGQQQ